MSIILASMQNTMHFVHYADAFSHNENEAIEIWVTKNEVCKIKWTFVSLKWFAQKLCWKSEKKSNLLIWKGFKWEREIWGVNFLVDLFFQNLMIGSFGLRWIFSGDNNSVVCWFQSLMQISKVTVDGHVIHAWKHSLVTTLNTSSCMILWRVKSACVTVPLLACAYEGAKEWKPHFLAWGSCDNPYPSLQKSWGWYTASWWTQKPSERIMKRKKTRFPSQVISVFPKRRGWLSFIQIKNQCFQHNFWANHFNETKVHFILQTSFVVTQISIASFSLWEKASA